MAYDKMRKCMNVSNVCLLFFHLVLIFWPIIFAYYQIALGNFNFTFLQILYQILPPTALGTLAVIGANSGRPLFNNFQVSTPKILIFVMFLGVATVAPILKMPNPQVHLLVVYVKVVLLILGIYSGIWLSERSEKLYALFVCSLCLGYVFFVFVVFPILPEFFEESQLSWNNGIIPFFNIRRFTHLILMSVAACTGLAIWIARVPRGRGILLAKALIFVYLIFGWTIIFWAGSRAPIFAYIGVTILLMVLLPRKDKIAYVVFWIGPSVLALSITDKLSGLGWSRSIWVRVSEAVDASSINQISSGRIDVWSLALENFVKSPLLGHGHETFLLLGGPVQTPHNFLLEMLHDFGIIGGLPVLLFVFIGVSALVLRSYRADFPGPALPGLLVIAIMVLQSFVDGVITGYYRLFLFALFWTYTSRYLQKLSLR